MARTVSKQVKLTLPDSVYEDLDFWAKREGRAPANLANFLVETAIRQAKRNGEYPKDDDENDKAKA